MINIKQLMPCGIHHMVGYIEPFSIFLLVFHILEKQNKFLLDVYSVVHCIYIPELVSVFISM